MIFNVINMGRSGHSSIIHWLLCQNHKEFYLGQGNGFAEDKTWRGYSLKRGNDNLLIHLQERNIDFIEGTKTELINAKKSNKLIILDNCVTQLTSPNILPHNFPIKHEEMTNIIVIRDWYNNYASLLKMGELDHLTESKTTEWKQVWIEQAKEALGMTDKLPNKVVILYNKWINNIVYRQKICKQLGLEFTDIGHNLVPIHGGGSSFDNNVYSSNARQMKVLERYKLYENNKNWFKTIDQEIVDLNIKLFRFYAPARFNHLNPRWYQIRKSIYESFINWWGLCRKCFNKKIQT